MAAAVLSPFGARLSSGGIRVATQTAEASVPAADRTTTTSGTTTTTTTNTNDDGVNLTSPPPCVNVALKILSSSSNCVQNDKTNGGAIVTYLKDILTLAGSAVGIVIILMLVIAGIQYITSAGDSGRVKAAKDRVVGAITALILFMFMVAILQFIVPGGIL